MLSRNLLVFSLSALLGGLVYAELPLVGQPPIPAVQPPPPAQTVAPGEFFFWYTDPITEQPVYMTGALTPRGETVQGNNRWRWDWTNGAGSWCDVVIWWNGGAGRWDIDIALVDGAGNRNFANIGDRVGHGTDTEEYAALSSYRAPGGAILPIPGHFVLSVSFFGTGSNTLNW